MCGKLRIFMLKVALGKC